MKVMGITISWRSEIPKIIKNFRDGMITLFAGLIPFQDTISKWLSMSNADFTTICGVAILVVGVLAKMFGVSDTVQSKSADFGNPGPGGSTNPPPSGLPPKP